MKELIIVGGGAAGFFLSANLNPDLWRVVILEQADEAMRKVKASGGGRCNLTHACFVIDDLVKFYPRGSKELKSVFARFQPLDTIDWFESRGVELKTEKDNRIFPASNSSLSVSSLLMRYAIQNGATIEYNSSVRSIADEGDFMLVKTNKQTYRADAVVVAAGSNPRIWDVLKTLGHSIIPPVPSLFTFKCKSPLLDALSGTSFENAELSLPAYKKIKEKGSLLITHQGLSGPAVLRLSAWAARELAECDYRFLLKINFVGKPFEELRELLQSAKNEHSKKQISSLKVYDLTQRFWLSMLQELTIAPDKVIGELSKSDINRIAEALTNTVLSIQGKNIFKNEFVTAGGLNLKEIDFSAMKSKKNNKLFLAGEVLNIDGITGGFNFQACWSEAFIISEYLNTSFNS